MVVFIIVVFDPCTVLFTVVMLVEIMVVFVVVMFVAWDEFDAVVVFDVVMASGVGCASGEVDSEDCAGDPEEDAGTGTVMLVIMVVFVVVTVDVVFTVEMLVVVFLVVEGGFTVVLTDEELLVVTVVLTVVVFVVTTVVLTVVELVETTFE
jgi:hypothetical protein